MTGCDLGEFLNLIYLIATTMGILVQDTMFEVAGKENAHSNVTVAASNEECVSCPPSDNTRGHQ